MTEKRAKRIAALVGGKAYWDGVVWVVMLSRGSHKLMLAKYGWSVWDKNGRRLSASETGNWYIPPGGDMSVKAKGAGGGENRPK